MTPARFYERCLSLWGEDWRPQLRDLLQAHGIRCKSRQTFCNWRKGTHPVPDRVAELLKKVETATIARMRSVVKESETEPDGVMMARRPAWKPPSLDFSNPAEPPAEPEAKTPHEPQPVTPPPRRRRRGRRAVGAARVAPIVKRPVARSDDEKGMPENRSSGRREPKTVSDARGLLLVLSGPSGVGKTTLARRWARSVTADWPPVVRSVSVTTRSPRPGEVDGVDYRFVSEADFAALLARAELLEATEAFGHRYGTPRGPVESHLAAGTDVLLVLDGRGRRQLAARGAADLVSIFLLPPSLDELERRLRGRAADREAIVQTRLDAARAELDLATEYDHVLVNRAPAATLASLQGIRRTERQRRRAGPQLAAAGEFLT